MAQPPPPPPRRRGLATSSTAPARQRSLSIVAQRKLNGGGWQCSFCTVVNDASAPRCTICGTGTRPVRTTPSIAPRAAGNASRRPRADVAQWRADFEAAVQADTAGEYPTAIAGYTKGPCVCVHRKPGARNPTPNRTFAIAPLGRLRRTDRHLPGAVLRAEPQYKAETGRLGLCGACATPVRRLMCDFCPNACPNACPNTEQRALPRSLLDPVSPQPARCPRRHRRSQPLAHAGAAPVHTATQANRYRGRVTELQRLQRQRRHHQPQPQPQPPQQPQRPRGNSAGLSVLRDALDASASDPASARAVSAAAAIRAAARPPSPASSSSLYPDAGARGGALRPHPGPAAAVGALGAMGARARSLRGPGKLRQAAGTYSASEPQLTQLTQPRPARGGGSSQAVASPTLRRAASGVSRCAQRAPSFRELGENCTRGRGGRGAGQWGGRPPSLARCALVPPATPARSLPCRLSPGIAVAATGGHGALPQPAQPAALLSTPSELRGYISHAIAETSKVASGKQALDLSKQPPQACTRLYQLPSPLSHCQRRQAS